jgi:DNA primase
LMQQERNVGCRLAQCWERDNPALLCIEHTIPAAAVRTYVDASRAPRESCAACPSMRAQTQALLLLHMT